MAKILVIEGDKATLLDKTKFIEEGKLQDYLENYPSLIPLGEIVEGVPDLLCIGREVGIPSGAIDLLFIDEDGLLTIVETKLAKNPEARRTVVGQIIEYASYICGWTADKVYEVANAYLKSERAPQKYKNLSLYEAIQKLSGISPEAEGEFSAENFSNSIERNLRSGKMRLLIAVDELVEPLRATITFLNKNSNFDILLLSVKNFEESKTRKVLIPTLFGPVKPPTPPMEIWTEPKFLKKVEECEKDVAETIKRLLEFAKSNGTAEWGRGKTRGSFTFVRFKNEARISIFTLLSDGEIWLNFGVMWNRVSKETLELFRAELNGIPNINIPGDAVTRGTFPSIKVKALIEPSNLDKFENAVLSLCQKIEAEEQ